MVIWSMCKKSRTIGENIQSPIETLKEAIYAEKYDQIRKAKTD
jgi:hypothetical protein